jgi:LL-H family phage holin
MDPAVTDVTSQITSIAVTVIITVFGILLTAVSGTIRSYLKAKLTTAQYETIDKLATDAVHAAEGYLGTGEGAAKKQALMLLVESIAKAGIKLTPEQLDAAIEAAVNKQFNHAEGVQPKPVETVVTLPPEQPDAA